MEIYRNSAASGRPKPPLIADFTRPNRDALDKSVEAHTNEAAERLQAAREEAAAGRMAALQPAESESTRAVQTAGSKAVARQIDEARETAIAGRIREGQKDEVRLSDQGQRITRDIEQRADRVAALRDDYRGGRLVTPARIEQAARGILGDRA